MVKLELNSNEMAVMLYALKQLKATTGSYLNTARLLLLTKIEEAAEAVNNKGEDK